jgi:hypothetical protein
MGNILSSLTKDMNTNYGVSELNGIEDYDPIQV